MEAANAVVFGSGPAWAAALEAALLLKEVSGMPAEGVETREGATSTMMALRPGDLALSLPTRADDALLAEAEEACAGRGARVLRLPCPRPRIGGSRPSAPSPPPPCSSASIGLARGLDVDKPAWTDAYYRVARGPA